MIRLNELTEKLLSLGCEINPDPRSRTISKTFGKKVYIVKRILSNGDLVKYPLSYYREENPKVADTVIINLQRHLRFDANWNSTL
ncbi:hypothetical protein CH370_19985 [Leptospira kmetyi]|uniref:Uncharacterized protein n=1 Tax=Leptospira kmetyi TaxID=408139 RepID=A0ABX4NAB1_9LEPT|nr:hypothetical protein CH378_14530 [Leptospira kmetyi]PJZ39734.1 hypothetical protein CH370_19985 [Leptospira kmetyi]